MDFKATIFEDAENDDAEVVWELRRLLASLGHTGQKPIRDWTRKQLPMLEAVLHGTGLEIGPELVPSRKSLISRGIDMDEWPAKVRDEWGITGRGMLLTLCASMLYKRGEHKRSCEAVLETLLEALVSVQLLDDPGLKLFFENPVMKEGSVCDIGIDEVGTCEHIRDAYMAVQSAQTAPKPRRLAKLFQLIFAKPCRCDSVGAWLDDIFRSVSLMIAEAASEADSSNALEATAVFGPKRRRRMDEDMRVAMCDVRKAGLAKNMRVWAKATQAMSASAANRVRDRQLQAYLAASNQRLHSVQTVRLDLDGARVGEPASEMLIGVLETPDGSGFACWIPPQAIS